MAVDACRLILASTDGLFAVTGTGRGVLLDQLDDLENPSSVTAVHDTIWVAGIDPSGPQLIRLTVSYPQPRSSAKDRITKYGSRPEPGPAEDALIDDRVVATRRSRTTRRGTQALVRAVGDCCGVPSGDYSVRTFLARRISSEHDLAFCWSERSYADV